MSMLSEFPRAATRLVDIALEIGRDTREIVLPSPCVCCGIDLPLSPKRRVGSCCIDCWTALPVLALPVCGYCGRCVPEGFTKCLECPGRSPLDWHASWGSFEGSLRDVIHAYKFRQHDFLAPELGELLREAWYLRSRESIDAVVSIPSSRRRVRERGYDHALLLARHFASRTGLRLEPSLLRRVRDNEVQSLLPKSRRAENVRGVFAAAEKADGQSILLIDDIETTGETLRAAAHILRREGARAVAALTIARV